MPGALRHYVVLAPAAVALAIYLPRVCPTLALLGDSPEMVAAAAVQGVAHAPGFPLNTLLGGLFARLPWFELPWRVNLMSALLHAATVSVIAATVRTVTRSALAAVAGALALALASAFALASLYAEVFPLNDLFFATVLFLAIRCRRAAQRDPDRRGDPTSALLVTLGVVSGLASANQETIILSAPALAVLVAAPLRHALRGRPARLAIYLAAFLVPLVAGYATLWLAASRDPLLSWGDVHDLRSLCRVFIRTDYADYLRGKPVPTLAAFAQRERLFAELVAKSVGAPVLAAAGLGLIAQWRRDRVEATALGLAFLVSGPLFSLVQPPHAHFTVTNLALVAIAERFLSMPLVPLAMLAGIGVGAIERWLRRQAPRVRPLAPLAAAAVILPLAPDALARDLRNDRRGIALAHDLVRQTPDGALVLVTGDTYVESVNYVCAVERTCGNRTFLAPGTLFLPWARAQLERRHPTLAAELPPDPGVTNIHVLVEQEIARRPVYVQPDFMVKDRALAAYPFAPDLLLVRLYPNAAAAEDDRPRVHARARAMVANEDCEGCSLYEGKDYHPDQEVIAKLAYSAAYANEGRAARTLLGDDALAAQLGARSVAIATGPP